MKARQVVALYQGLDHALREARSLAQEIIRETPVYAPCPWMRQVDGLLSTAHLMADAARSDLERWVNIQHERRSDERSSDLQPK